MPVFTLYVASCGMCGEYASRPGTPRPAVEDWNDAFISTSEQDATVNAIEQGWSAYPLLCPGCNEQAKKRAVNTETGR